MDCQRLSENTEQASGTAGVPKWLNVSIKRIDGDGDEFMWLWYYKTSMYLHVLR